jgi:hypothetical protein|tara:strand:+ start:276 stop:386 length:111 start_codon:yes stop_codon:yes gene_type:complete
MMVAQQADFKPEMIVMDTVTCGIVGGLASRRRSRNK